MFKSTEREEWKFQVKKRKERSEGEVQGGKMWEKVNRVEQSVGDGGRES